MQTMTVQTPIYDTKIDQIDEFHPSEGDLCEELCRVIRAAMKDDDTVVATFLLGEHFDSDDEHSAKQTFPDIETIHIAKGNSTAGYYDRCHNYVLPIWNLGVLGSIDVLTEKDLHMSGGIDPWLTGQLEMRKLTANV